MGQAWKKLFLWSIAAGVFLRVVMWIAVKILVQGNPGVFTEQMGVILNGIHFGVVILCFFIIGFGMRRNYSKKEIAKAARLLALYTAAALVVERFAMLSLTPVVLMLYQWMYLPIEMFTVVTQVMMSLGDLPYLALVLPSVFAPYLYVLFGENAAVSEKSNEN